MTTNKIINTLVQIN